jgi:methylmalonyl-CoA/ethylmalonyl-CoA epimerase
MKLSTLGQVAVPVSDADAAQAFYGEALGLTLLFRAGDLVFFDCDGVRLMLETRTAPVPPSGCCLYFKVAGIASAHAELSGRGVVFLAPPHLVARMPDHELWMAFFRDPDGHLLAVMEERRGGVET